MNKLRMMIGLVGLLSAVTVPLQAEWMVDPAQSRIGFVAFSRIHDAEGLFEAWRFDGTIGEDFKGAGTVTVKLSSVNSGNAKRDAHLLNQDFFDVSRFPEAVYRIEAARLEGDVVRLSGKLSLHGVERPLGISLSRRQMADGWDLSGEAMLPRRDFGMDYDSFINPIKNDVRLKIHLVLKRK